MVKYEILDDSIDLYSIFMSYKNILKIDINDANLKENFLIFLEQIITEGYIKLAKWSIYPEIPELECLASKEQVDIIRNAWPDKYNEKIPEMDIEGLWWVVKCPLTLADVPDWERIREEKEKLLDDLE